MARDKICPATQPTSPGRAGFGLASDDHSQDQDLVEGREGLHSSAGRDEKGTNESTNFRTFLSFGIINLSRSIATGSYKNLLLETSACNIMLLSKSLLNSMTFKSPLHPTPDIRSSTSTTCPKHPSHPSIHPNATQPLKNKQ